MLLPAEWSEVVNWWLPVCQSLDYEPMPYVDQAATSLIVIIQQASD